MLDRVGLKLSNEYGIIQRNSVENKGKSDVSQVNDNFNPEQPGDAEHKKWLVILYSAGDNNLYSYLFDDLDELETVGSDKNTHIVSVADQGKYGTKFKGAKMFYLTQDQEKGKINSAVLEDLGQVNMADPNFMGQKIGELMKKYPSTYVTVIISDHGAGWEGAVEDDSPLYKFMKLSEVKQALQKAVEIGGKKIDVLGWDACLMAMAEVGYELKDVAKYMVASEQLEGADGWPYGTIFSSTLRDVLKVAQQMMLVNIDVEPKDFATMIVKASQNFTHSIKTLSAVDLEKAQELANKTDELAKAILNNPDSFSKIKDALRKTEKFYGSFRDLGHFAKILQSIEVSDEIKQKAVELEKTLNEYVVKEFHTDAHPNATGVSVEMPTYYGTSSSYKQTDFAKNTSWDEMLDKVVK
ncbi:MAG: clostripain-related cysteine peptidase [Candidatus Calescibacterium sp.]|nr:clostripain-related cysteine peptidase [Candidatus Calescibacterium sp.]